MDTGKNFVLTNLSSYSRFFNAISFSKFLTRIYFTCDLLISENDNYE